MEERAGAQAKPSRGAVSGAAVGAASEAIDRGGVYWSIVSLGVASASGLVLNIVISSQYPTQVLGTFNLLLAVFLIGGQAGALGLQAAVLFHTPRAGTLGTSTSQVLRAVLWMSAVTSLVASAVVVLGGEAALALMDSDTYRPGLWAIGVGLFLYPLNKALMAHLNGLRRIRAYSAVFALRYVLLMGFVAAGAAFGIEGDQLPWAVTAAEVVVGITVVVLLAGELWPSGQHVLEEGLTARMFRFGLRGFTGGLLLDLNTRVDLLILGALAGPSAVGRYSIASVFAEGLFQLALVTRSTFDPIIARLYVSGRRDELFATVARARRRVYRFIVPLAIVTVAGYRPVVGVMFGAAKADSTWAIYSVLAAGVVVCAGYVPFIGLLQQTGNPGAQSRLVALVSGTNIVLNLALLPVFGVIGSAIGTAIAQASLVPYLRHLSARTLGKSV